MQERRRRLPDLLAHWPELSEQERVRLLVALGVNGVLSMTLEVVAIAGLAQVARRSWRVRGRAGAAAGRTASVSHVGRWILLSAGQKATARLAFTSYERHLSRRSRSRSGGAPG